MTIECNTDTFVDAGDFWARADDRYKVASLLQAGIFSPVSANILLTFPDDKQTLSANDIAISSREKYMPVRNTHLRRLLLPLGFVGQPTPERFIPTREGMMAREFITAARNLLATDNSLSPTLKSIIQASYENPDGAISCITPSVVKLELLDLLGKNTSLSEEQLFAHFGIPQDRRSAQAKFHLEILDNSRLGSLIQLTTTQTYQLTLDGQKFVTGFVKPIFELAYQLVAS